MNRVWLFLTILLLAVAVLLIRSSAIKPDDLTAGSESLVLQLQWFDQAQFVGFYVAQAKGFYKDRGIDIQVRAGGFNVNPLSELLEGRAQVALATGDQVLLARAGGRPILAIGTIFDGSMACFMTRTESGIDSPSDFKHRTVGVYRGFDTENVLLGLLWRHNIPADRVKIVEAGSPEAFVTGDIDVFPSYVFNEPLKMRAQGIPVKCLEPDAFGIRAYSDTLVTTEDYFARHRPALRRFLEATSAGWADARHNQTEALALMTETRPNVSSDAESRSHQQAMLTEVAGRLRAEAADDHRILRMDPSRWRDMEQWLVEIGKAPRRGIVDDLCAFDIAEDL